MPRAVSARRLAQIGLMAALTAVGAFLRVPLPYVPITLQLPIVCAAGILLGPRAGAASQAVYLAAGLLEVARLAPRRGLMVVLSDCYDEEGLLRGLRLVRHEGFDAAVVRLVDLRPPPSPGDLRVIDVESGRRADVTLTRDAARRLEEARRRLSARLRQGAHALEVSYQERPIQEPIAESVLRALREGSLVEQHVATARAGAWT